MSNVLAATRAISVRVLIFVPLCASLVAAEPAPPPRPVVRLKETPDKQAKAYKALFERVGKSGLVGLSKDEDTSLALQAAWEIHKKLIISDKQVGWRPKHTYDPKEMNKFVAFFKERTQAPVPDWWVDGIVDLAVWEGEFHLWVEANSRLREYTEIAFPNHVWYVRKGVDIAMKAESCTYKAGGVSIDFPKPKAPTDRFVGDCLIDAPGKTITCLGVYRSSRPLRFDLAGFETKSGKRLWLSEVWALGEWGASGPNSDHRAALVTKGATIYVFGAARQGLYAEAFDLETGHCMYRFCTSYWGHWSEKWDLNPGQ
jgi:hypothetical protein